MPVTPSGDKEKMSFEPIVDQVGTRRELFCHSIHYRPARRQQSCSVVKFGCCVAEISVAVKVNKRLDYDCDSTVLPFDVAIR